MRFLVDHDEEKKQLANKKGEVALNLSMVNTYVARSLGILSNCSSVATKADTNPDPRELNYKLDQQPFISGMSQVRVEKSNTSEDHLLTVRRLLELALTNVTQESGLLSGLSVPVYHEHLEGLRRILRSPHTEDQAFLEQLEQYNLESGPIEFSTAERVVIIYGQPDKHYSVHKKHLIEHACGKFFSNSQFVSYSFRHPWDFDQLLILIVDPMIMPVASSIYYYINNAWGKTDENLRDKLDAVINSPRFDKNQLTNVIGEKEQFPEIIYGPGTQDIQNNLTRAASLAVTRDQVIRAFEHVHHIYYRKRPDLETSPRFRRRPIAPL
jgi:hypothetical protein